MSLNDISGKCPCSACIVEGQNAIKVQIRVEFFHKLLVCLITVTYPSVVHFWKIHSNCTATVCSVDIVVYSLTLVKLQDEMYQNNLVPTLATH